MGALKATFDDPHVSMTSEHGYTEIRIADATLVYTTLMPQRDPYNEDYHQRVMVCIKARDATIHLETLPLQLHDVAPMYGHDPKVQNE